MKCPICGEEMLAGGLISAGISVGQVPKDEFDKKGLRRISYQEWHSIGNSSILLGQTKIPNAFLCKKYNKVIGVFDVRKTFSHYEAVTLQIKEMNSHELWMGNCFHFSGMVCRACD